MFYATLNRTAKSYLLAILGAEYILRWLPTGTHDWHKFLTPQELTELADKSINIQVISTSEIKISVLVDADYTELGVRALHAAFNLDGGHEGAG